jgi:hypothetical protein
LPAPFDNATAVSVAVPERDGDVAAYTRPDADCGSVTDAALVARTFDQPGVPVAASNCSSRAVFDDDSKLVAYKLEPTTIGCPYWRPLAEIENRTANVDTELGVNAVSAGLAPLWPES